METGYLREFVVFAETLNYTVAAKRLFIAQPTLSSHIASLEKSVGVNLVEKRGGHLALTPAGKYLLNEARDISERVDTMIAGCKRVDASVIQINVRLDTSYFDSCIDRAAKIFQERYPGREIIVNVVDTPGGRRQALASGAIDFDIGGVLNLRESGAIVNPACLYDKNVHCFLQDVDQILFWINASNPLFGHTDAIRLDDLRGATLCLTADDSVVSLGQQLREYLAGQGVQIQVTHRQCGSLQEYYMSDLGNAIGVMSERNLRGPGFYAHDSRRTAFSVANLNLHNEIYTTYREKDLLTDKLEFIGILRELADNSGTTSAHVDERTQG